MLFRIIFEVKLTFHQYEEVTIMKYYEERDEKLKKIYTELLKCMPDHSQRFVDYCVYKNRTANTIRGYVQDLDLFFYYITVTFDEIESQKDISLEFLENFTYLDFQRYNSFLSGYTRNGKTYKNGTRSCLRKLSAIRGYYRYFKNIEHSMTKNPADDLPLPDTTDQRNSVVALDDEDISKLISIVRNMSDFSEHQKAYLQRDHLRDTALILVLLGTGLRISECIGIDLEDISFRKQEIRIHRKGNFSSEVFFNDDISTAIQDYMECERKPKNPDEKALFLSSRGTRLSVRTAQDIVRKYTDRIGIIDKIYAHRLRSTFASMTYQKNGADPVLIKNALGHRNLSTIQRYVKDDVQARKQAAKKGIW